MLVDRLKALFDAGKRAVPGEMPDRRADPRRRVSLDAMILPISGYADLRIVNASRTGFGGETTACLEAARPLFFCLEGNRFHQGTVRWIRGRTFGADFDDALGILGHSGGVDPGHLASHTARARRRPVERTGRIALGSVCHRAIVHDVSQSGMRLEFEARPAVGQEVIVCLDDHLLLATVRWCANRMAGIETAQRIQTLRLAYASRA